MKKITPSELVSEIAQLGTERIYDYVSGKGKVRITSIEGSEGPINFERFKTDGSETGSGSVSIGQLATMAVVCSSKPNYPLHIDRVFSAGGNSRSAFETLLAYTPHFFTCNPKRVDAYSGEIKSNLKHIMWCPDEEHPLGIITKKEYLNVIADVDAEVSFGDIQVTSAELGDEFETIEAKTTHTQMQIALIEIGRALGFDTWIARNDRAIPVGNTKLGNLPGVISSLSKMDIFYKPEIKEAATLVDCIWFTRNGDRIPAVIEIEHSTGVTSGMTRMRKLQDVMPSILTQFTIVAPNQLRNKVIAEANREIFRNLSSRYMPYSTVRELYGLVQRYDLSGSVDHKFINPFMESVVE